MSAIIRMAGVTLAVIILAVTALATVTPAGATLAAQARHHHDAVPPPLVVIMMENHGLSFILHDTTDMPFENALRAGTAPGIPSQALGWTAACHPSRPNYEMATSGIAACGSDTVPAGGFTDPSVWGQLQTAGITWAGYAESMPSACYQAGSFNGDPSGPYVLRHFPVFYAGVLGVPALCGNALPLTSLDLNQLPAVSWITPNLCDDMHGVSSTAAAKFGWQDCVTGSTALEQRADSWLAGEVTQLANAGADVLVTYDECCGTALGPVYAVLAGPGVTAGTGPSGLGPASIAAGIEQAYGLPYLGAAATAVPLSWP